jgi:hypothetical protein
MTHQHPHTLRAGQTVVHRSLDASNGTAKVGVVTEAIDEGLVIARWRDEQREVGFSARELQPLVTLPLLSRGPVLLRPSQLVHWLRGLLRSR